jgi:hypothetical protein
MRSSVWFGGLLVLVAMPALAQDVIIYRCTDASGGLAIQNMPCPKGTQQQKKVMPALQTAPTYVSPAPSAPSAAITATSRPADATTAQPAPAPPTPAHEPETQPPRLPPPPLFECSTRDNDHYLTENEQAASRCVPMRTTGLDGNPLTGAGEACEVVTDRCARVPDGTACDAWNKRLLEAESHWRFALPEHVEQRKQEYERLRRIIEESSCGAAG